MHLLPLEINAAPSKVNNKTLLIFLGPDQPLYTWVRPYSIIIFLCNFWNINPCFCPCTGPDTLCERELRRQLTSPKSCGRWNIQPGFPVHWATEHRRAPLWTYGTKRWIINMLLTYLVIIHFHYLTIFSFPGIDKA